MDNVTAALIITVLVHFAGVGVLVWALFDGEDADLRGWWRGGDDPRDQWPEPPTPIAPRGDLPLPDADPARVRLREPGRIGPAYVRPERRPAHVPAPAPAREHETV